MLAQLHVLLTTDVAARGLHLKNLAHVVNYDMAPTVEMYTHRIGRTGRQGAVGYAYTLFSEDDRELARGLIRLLEGCEQQVQNKLRQLAQKAEADVAEGQLLGQKRAHARGNTAASSSSDDDQSHDETDSENDDSGAGSSGNGGDDGEEEDEDTDGEAEEADEAEAEDEEDEDDEEEQAGSGDGTASSTPAHFSPAQSPGQSAALDFLKKSTTLASLLRPGYKPPSTSAQAQASAPGTATNASGSGKDEAANLTVGGGDAPAPPVTADGARKPGQSLAEYIEEQLAKKLSTTGGAVGVDAATGGPMSAMRRLPVKPGEAEDYRPTVSEVLAAEAQRQNFREMKWRDKQGLTRYGLHAGSAKKGKHKVRGKNMK